MAEKYGVALLKECVESAAEVLNVVSKVLNKQGLWHLISLQSPVKTFSTLNFEQFKQEVADCSEAEREALEAAFSAKLSLVKANVTAKFNEAINLVEDGADLVEDGVAAGKDLFARGQAIVAQAKALVGV